MKVGGEVGAAVTAGLGVGTGVVTGVGEGAAVRTGEGVGVGTSVGTAVETGVGVGGKDEEGSASAAAVEGAVGAGVSFGDTVGRGTAVAAGLSAGAVLVGSGASCSILFLYSSTISVTAELCAQAHRIRAAAAQSRMRAVRFFMRAFLSSGSDLQVIPSYHAGQFLSMWIMRKPKAVPEHHVSRGSGLILHGC